jgi:predicted Zn-dependent protease
MGTARTTGLALALAGLLASGCALGPVSDRSSPQTGQRSESGPALERVTAQDAARLRRVIEPLVRAADKPPAQVKIGIMSDKSINAANAGGGEFYVTRGLLDRASDEQLLAIMAHEVAHNDLGHVAKAQAVNAGVGIGAAILEQVIPQTAIITPIAGTLITRAHSRSEELEADRHAVTLLKRVGSSKQALENTLAWLARMSGGRDGGGWFATHPGTNERIQALRQLPA